MAADKIENGFSVKKRLKELAAEAQQIKEAEMRKRK